MRYSVIIKTYVTLHSDRKVRSLFAQYQQTFRSHIEQQVYDTQIRQETQFGLKNLIVRLWDKFCIYFPEILFRMNYFPKSDSPGANSILYSEVRSMVG